MLKTYCLMLLIFFLTNISYVHSMADNKNNNANNALPASEIQTETNQYLLGIDVSHYQGSINWIEVEEANVHYVMVKATEGVTYVDPLFYRNWRHLNKVKIIRGAYHFFNTADDPLNQAKHYYQTIGQLVNHDLPPIVDVEQLGSVSPDKLLDNLLVYLQAIEKLTKRIPIIYTNQAFGQQYLHDVRLNKYFLWIAEYEGLLTELPVPWRTQGWHFWQYSQQGQILGIASTVDLNHYQGSYEQLKLFIEQSAF